MYLNITHNCCNMQIFFKNLEGICYVLEVTGEDTIENVKALVGGKTGDKPCDFDLIYAGKWLKGDNTLSDYNISKESTLHMKPKMGHKNSVNLLCSQLNIMK